METCNTAVCRSIMEMKYEKYANKQEAERHVFVYREMQRWLAQKDCAAICIPLLQVMSRINENEGLI